MKPPKIYYAFDDPHWHRADCIMRSKEGQSALQGGYASPLYWHALCEGPPLIPHDILRGMELDYGFDLAIIKNVSKAKHPMREALLDVYKAIENLETQLKKRYLAAPVPLPVKRPLLNRILGLLRLKR